MSMSAASDATRLSSRSGLFVRARLGSFLAVVPLAIWVTAHLWHNLSAFDGAERWQADVTEYASPLTFFVSSVVALLPLALHTVWGIARMTTMKPNVVRYGYFANVRYVLQRLSAIGLLFFVGAHLWLAMLSPRMQHHHAETFADIAAHMRHHTPTLVVYILGVLGVAYHLANGLETFAMGWGVVSSRRALKHLDCLGVAVFVAILVLGLASVYALWDAGAAYPAP